MIPVMYNIHKRYINGITLFLMIYSIINQYGFIFFARFRAFSFCKIKKSQHNADYVVRSNGFLPDGSKAICVCSHLGSG